jgi:Protein of unknown function (DUF3892)
VAIRIIRVSKPSGNNLNPHEAIQNVEWVEESTGKTGRWARLELYDWIKIKGGKAYVKDAAHDVADVYTRENAHGTKFVQTYADGIWKDNYLLSLPNCA